MAEQATVIPESVLPEYDRFNGELILSQEQLQMVTGIDRDDGRYFLVSRTIPGFINHGIVQLTNWLVSDIKGEVNVPEMAGIMHYSTADHFIDHAISVRTLS
ncbi:MAG: hypothetical protein ACOCXQ_02345 [Patescibacteria group bacterium]